jgi:hypothetical protein
VAYKIERQAGDDGLDGWFQVVEDHGTEFAKTVYEGLECKCREWLRDRLDAEQADATFPGNFPGVD